jgi:hypothetical protein
MEQSVIRVPLADEALISSRYVCRLCKGETYRVKRRKVDLLISRGFLVHRYQCVAFKCKWSGLFHPNPPPIPTPGSLKEPGRGDTSWD